jgi:hypothetical protein
MNMKKFFLLILGLFLLTGCTVQQQIAEVEEDVARLIFKDVIDADTEDCRYLFKDQNGDQYLLEGEVYCYSAFLSAISPDSKKLVYIDFPRVVLFNAESNDSLELMSILDTADGASFFWSPDSREIAVAIVNQVDESYLSTVGTKLFILEIDENGHLINKNIYPIKIRYECHDAGCNVFSDDFYFRDNETVIYRSWESETPYEDAGNDELLRVLEL